MKPTLKLTFDAGWGDTYSMVIDIEERVAQKIQKVNPPMMHGSPLPWMPGEVPLQSFDEVCEILKVRELRKDLFVHEATRLGRLLAERMEDSEGWHDPSRVDPAKDQLAGRK